VRTSLSEISTVSASFADDVSAYAAAGFDGIGIWELKLPADDKANRALVREHGLAVANCVPAVPSFLPLGIPGMEGPADPTERRDAICASIRRFAAFEPECVLCLPGPTGERSDWDARRIVLDGLQAAAATARDVGVTLAFEPVHRSQRGTVSFVNSIGDAIDLLDEARLDDVALLIDLWHVWDDELVWDFVGRASYRIAGVHVADWPDDAGRTDRVLPGEGVSDTKALVDALALSGWDGYLDVEIFSEPERFWALPVEEAARQAHAALTALLDRSGNDGERAGES
jgi:sugar phosphate isomerase/epimerase